MTAWTKTKDGWRLELGAEDGEEPSLPRLEIHTGKGAWIVCVLGPASGRACAGAAWSVEDAQRAAIVEAQKFLDSQYQPLLGQLLSERSAGEVGDGAQ